MRTIRFAMLLSAIASAPGCAIEGDEGSISPDEADLATASSALLSGKLFPFHAEDLPPTGLVRATNAHYDMHVVRFDSSGAWSKFRSGVTSPAALDDYLVYGIPVYASDDGEVVTCWRNAPENGIGVPHPGRDGCNDEDNDGNPCDQNATCSCTVPRSGNHVSILGADGNNMLYAHLQPGSVPTEICPHEDLFVTDAEEIDPTLGGSKGHNPDMFVPVGSRAKIQKGQFLGYVGHSGASSGPHLHHGMANYATGSKVVVNYVGAQYQEYPGGTTNISPLDWETLDGTTPLLTSDSDPEIVVLPSEGPGSVFGYAWAQSATTDHASPAGFSRNSSGDVEGLGVTNSVDHISTGEYLVALPGIGHSEWSGNVQVVAHGTDNTRCKLRGALALFGGMAIRVDCHAPNGALADSKFIVSYVRNGSPTNVGEGAYLTTTDEGSGVVPIVNQWSSSGEPNSVSRVSAGRYTARLPGQLPYPRGGTVQVTAFGDGSDHCKVGSWFASGNAVSVDVRCFDTSGAPSDSLFSLYYTPRYASGGLSGGHAWANNAAAASYSPSASFEYTFKAGAGEIPTSTTASRTSAGVYHMRYPAMSTTGSTALVTAYGTTSEYCKVSSWAAAGNDSVVNIRCFNAAGNPTDTRYVSGYANYDFAIL